MISEVGIRWYTLLLALSFSLVLLSISFSLSSPCAVLLSSLLLMNGTRMLFSFCWRRRAFRILRDVTDRPIDVDDRRVCGSEKADTCNRGFALMIAFMLVADRNRNIADTMVIVATANRNTALLPILVPTEFKLFLGTLGIVFNISWQG